MAASELPVLHSVTSPDAPKEQDLLRCVHCGLCLNACPTYRDLRVEMDSPRGRIYQMVQVSNGAPITDSYREHIDLCLACRGCETACPSGVPYGRMVEAARAHIQASSRPSFWQRAKSSFLLKTLIPSPAWLQIAGAALYGYQVTGLQTVMRATGVIRLFGRLADLDAITPDAQVPFFFRRVGITFPAEGNVRYRVAFLSGCIANVAFARLNEATIRV